MRGARTSSTSRSSAGATSRARSRLQTSAMCAMYPSSFGKRAESTRHEALRKWFVHIRSPQDCGGGGGSAHDMPRKRQPCTALQLEDWRFCKRALLHWRWLDEDGRSRRHHGLQHAYEMNDEAGREGNQRAWEDAQELQRLLSVSKTLCFGNLTGVGDDALATAVGD